MPNLITSSPRPHHPLRVSAFCLLIATLAACPDTAVDPAPTHNPSARSSAETLAAIAARDWSVVADQLDAYQSAPGVMIAVEQGIIDGYESSPSPLLVRHSKVPDRRRR